MEWKIELNLWTKTILTRGSEFFMDWMSWSRTEATKRTTTTGRKPMRWSSKNLRWRRMYLLLRADQRLAKPRRRTSACSSTRTVPICEKILDSCRARNLFAYRLPSVKTAEYSSSSWWSTSGRRWSDWILKIKRLSSVRTKFEQRKIDSIFYGCGSYEQGTQRSVWHWLGSTTSCMVQTENVEKTSRRGVLGRFSTCSTERISVLSNKIERNHPVRHPPSLLYPESFHDGIWRNQIRESFCVTSTSSKDFLQNDNWWKNWIQKLLEVVKTPNKSTQNPIIKSGETCKWATTWFAYSRDRKRCLVWLRKHQRKNGETC